MATILHGTYSTENVKDRYGGQKRRKAGLHFSGHHECTRVNASISCACTSVHLTTGLGKERGRLSVARAQGGAHECARIDSIGPKYVALSKHGRGGGIWVET